MLSKPPPDREDSDMTEIELKHTPRGKKFELQQAINDLMEVYEHTNGLEILSMSFRREPIIGSRQPVRKPVVSIVVQVPE